MKNLNAETIKKALKCCNSVGHICGKCPYESVCFGISCRDKLSRDALSLITSQEQRIKELTEENERLRDVKSEYETFIGELKPKIDSIRAEVKADIVRKMQERLTDFFNNDDTVEYIEVDAVYINEQIEKIAKEMVEGYQKGYEQGVKDLAEKLQKFLTLQRQHVQRGGSIPRWSD